MNTAFSFADPQKIQEDLSWMRYMVETVAGYLHNPTAPEDALAPHSYNGVEEDGRLHRVVLTRPELLREEIRLTVVGFFGEVRPGAETAEAVHKADDELIGDFPNFGGLICYMSLQLPCGQWGNLALFKNEAARDEWARNDRHTKAVRELSAKHYTSIRLHNAKLIGHLRENHLEMERTKYYAYDSSLVWRAVRDNATQQLSA